MRVSLEDVWQRYFNLVLLMDFLEITCQQQLLTECVLSQGHIQVSGWTEYNSVSDLL